MLVSGSGFCYDKWEALRRMLMTKFFMLVRTALVTRKKQVYF